jgi:hypothetical protein
MIERIGRNDLLLNSYCEKQGTNKETKRLYIHTKQSCCIFVEKHLLQCLIAFTGHCHSFDMRRPEPPGPVRCIHYPFPAKCPDQFSDDTGRLKTGINPDIFTITKLFPYLILPEKTGMPHDKINLGEGSHQLLYM